MKEKVQRRLAAIVSADVVGYSRLMGVDETGTLVAFRSHRSELIDSSIAEHGGRIVKTMGDGLLLEYPSVVDATQCMIEVQTAMAERNQGVDADKRLVFRVGINLGDIIIEGDDILGNEVNIAARLQEIAEPGGISISRRVYEDVQERLDARFEDSGEHSLKNIARPVQVWQWSLQPVTNTDDNKILAESTVDEGLPLPDKPSIAVLPFNNMSGDSEQEYFADGMSEDIITALSRSPWLFVIARNSTFTYKGKSTDIKQIAQELGVRYVLEGSVRKSANRIRVTAQLIDGSSGGHVWSERYDGELTDIFDLQDEITRKVVASVLTQVHLTASKTTRRSKRPDLTVWELTMRGWQLLYDFSVDSYSIAKTVLEKAIKLDPESAEAHLVLSLIHHHNAFMGLTEDIQAAQKTANDLALRATRLDNQNEYAHWALGISYLGTGGYKESVAALTRALELNPNCSVAYGSLGTALVQIGRLEEAISNSEISIRSNPRDPSIFFRFTVISLAHFLAGRYELAIEWADKAINRMPSWYLAHLVLAASYVQANRVEEAQLAIDHCLKVIPDITISSLDRFPLKNIGDMQLLRDSLQKTDLKS
ncbi:MAG: adenylate cyclase [Parasphingorhabdus sp.]|jgi:adenylate cyclase